MGFWQKPSGCEPKCIIQWKRKPHNFNMQNQHFTKYSHKPQLFHWFWQSEEDTSRGVSLIEVSNGEATLPWGEDKEEGEVHANILKFNQLACRNTWCACWCFKWTCKSIMTTCRSCN